MKRLMIIVFVMLLVVAPAMLPAATFWDGMKVPLGQFVGVILTIFGVPVLIKLSRKWGIEITDAQAAAALDALINLLINNEYGDAKDQDPMTKKKIGVLTARNTLPKATIDILEKKHGSLEAAVEKAFQSSSLNRKGAK